MDKLSSIRTMKVMVILLIWLWGTNASATELGIQQGFPDIFVSNASIQYDSTAGQFTAEDTTATNYQITTDGTAFNPLVADNFLISAPVNNLGELVGPSLLRLTKLDSSAPSGESILLELDLTRIAFGGSTDVENEVQFLGDILTSAIPGFGPQAGLVLRWAGAGPFTGRGAGWGDGDFSADGVVNVNIFAVPLPSTLALMLLAAAGIRLRGNVRRRPAAR